ncbi:MAG: hypothetical protein OQK82_00390, partial [Candidatus Pacearchaeota archaeon]|nr:hypothetical protein [Candidatus Pacearchaeota archaeon]
SVCNTRNIRFILTTIGNPDKLIFVRIIHKKLSYQVLVLAFSVQSTLSLIVNVSSIIFAGIFPP